MFGSIKPKDQSIDEPLLNNDNDNELNILNEQDPWDDTSLIQFWHNSIGSYKIKHDKSLVSSSKRDPLKEKLDQSMKHKLSSSDNELTNQKRQKLQHNDQSSIPTIKLKSAAIKKTSIKSIENVEEGIDAQEQQIDDEYDNDQQQQEEVGDEVGVGEEEEYNDNNEQVDNEYGAGNQDYNDYYQNYYLYGQHHHQYPYQQNYYPYPPQPSMPFPPPHPSSSSSSSMPFPPPPPPMPGLSSSSSHPMQQQNDNELLTNLIMAWYYSGYYTGLYQAQQR